jgi:hypothetical protein
LPSSTVVSKLPGSQTRAIGALALFTSVQVADAVCTANGIARFGPAIEANPFLSFLVGSWGIVGALVSVKIVAIVGGTFLHLKSQDLALSLLTVVYVFFALVPWAWTLAT